MLLDAARDLTGWFLDDLTRIGAGAPFSEAAMGRTLPRAYLSRLDGDFAKRYAVAAIAVSYKLAQQKPSKLSSSTPSSVAEEMLLWHMIDLAHERAAEGGRAGSVEAMEFLRDALFQDTDFLFLFDPKFDGIEESRMGEQLGVGHVHSSEWFLPFGNAQDDPHPYLRLGMEDEGARDTEESN
jgi:hypothetical protein